LLGPIALRAATADDLPFLSRLYRDTRRQELEGWGWPREQREWLLQMQFDARQRSYGAAYPKAEDRIVYVQDAPVGRMLLNHEPAGLQLIDLALLEEYRNQGLGTELLRRLQHECERDRIALSLQVLRANPAMRLYQRLGFAEVSADPVYARLEWLPVSSPRGA
jgi:ribosomal protein S18 acetylase RimI-like enzyme